MKIFILYINVLYIYTIQKEKKKRYSNYIHKMQKGKQQGKEKEAEIEYNG